jgi:hypothetical protein
MKKRVSYEKSEECSKEKDYPAYLSGGSTAMFSRKSRRQVVRQEEQQYQGRQRRHGEGIRVRNIHSGYSAKSIRAKVTAESARILLQ